MFAWLPGRATPASSRGCSEVAGSHRLVNGARLASVGNGALAIVLQQVELSSVAPVEPEPRSRTLTVTPEEPVFFTLMRTAANPAL